MTCVICNFVLSSTGVSKIFCAYEGRISYTDYLQEIWWVLIDFWKKWHDCSCINLIQVDIWITCENWKIIQALWDNLSASFSIEFLLPHFSQDWETSSPSLSDTLSRSVAYHPSLIAADLDLCHQWKKKILLGIRKSRIMRLVLMDKKKY